MIFDVPNTTGLWAPETQPSATPRLTTSTAQGYPSTDTRGPSVNATAPAGASFGPMPSGPRHSPSSANFLQTQGPAAPPPVPSVFVQPAILSEVIGCMKDALLVRAYIADLAGGGVLESPNYFFNQIASGTLVLEWSQPLSLWTPLGVLGLGQSSECGDKKLIKAQLVEVLGLVEMQGSRCYRITRLPDGQKLTANAEISRPRFSYSEGAFIWGALLHELISTYSSQFITTPSTGTPLHELIVSNKLGFVGSICYGKYSTSIMRYGRSRDDVLGGFEVTYQNGTVSSTAPSAEYAPLVQRLSDLAACNRFYSDDPEIAQAVKTWTRFLPTEQASRLLLKDRLAQR